MICVLIPLTWNIISTILDKPKDLVPKSTPDGHSYKELTSDLYRATMKQRQKERFDKRKRFGYSFWGKVVLFVAISYATYICFLNMNDTSLVKGFDPFTILQIQEGSKPNEIKKAYRHQSLKHHPDKNPNDPLAASKFNLIHKAYEVLTDETAKANFEKYGNPDGPTAMKIGVGLPRILVEEDNQLAILCIFFIILLLVVPIVFISYYQHQKKYAPNGVQLETLQFLTYNMTENSRVRQGVELLSCSAESRELKLRPEDRFDMKKITDNVQDMRKSKYNLPIIVRNNYLITAHMQRLHDQMSDGLRKDLDTILKASLRITHSMIEIAAMRNWLTTAASMVEFRRSLVQGLNVGSSEFLQIPYFDEDVVKHVVKGKNSVSTLRQFVHQEASERKGLAGLSANQIDDITEFCNYFTRMEVKATIAVEDETEFVVNDVATVTVNFTRSHLNDGEAQGPVFAPLFPAVKFEEWFIFLMESHTGNMITMTRTQNPEKHFSETLQFQIGNLGKQCVTLKIMNDSYIGLDQEIEITYNVFTEQQVKRTVFVHEDDEALDNEPTFFQQIMGSVEEGASSDEEEEKEEQKDK